MNGDDPSGLVHVLWALGPLIFVVGVIVSLIALAVRSRDHDRRLRRLERRLHDDDDDD